MGGEGGHLSLVVSLSSKSFVRNLTLQSETKQGSISSRDLPPHHHHHTAYTWGVWSRVHSHTHRAEAGAGAGAGARFIFSNPILVPPVPLTHQGRI